MTGARPERGDARGRPRAAAGGAAGDGRRHSTRRSATAASSASTPATSTATSTTRQRLEFLGSAGRLARRARDHGLGAARRTASPERLAERVLNDGSRHQVYKRWFTPAGLIDELGGGEVVFAASGSCRCASVADAGAGGAERAAGGALAEAEPRRQRLAAVERGEHELRDRRAVLEAVARAGADDPRRLERRVRRGDEVRVGRQLVAAAAALPQRRVRERGEAAREVRADVRLRPRPPPAARRRGPAAGPRRRAPPSRRGRRGRPSRTSRGRSRPSPAPVRQAGPPSKNSSSWQVAVSETTPGKRPPSQPPHAHTTASPSMPRAVLEHAAPSSGRARPRTIRAPCSCAWPASACTARCARTTPASGSWTREGEVGDADAREQPLDRRRVEPLDRDARARAAPARTPPPSRPRAARTTPPRAGDEEVRARSPPRAPARASRARRAVRV